MKFTITNDGLTAFFGGEAHTMKRGDTNFEQIYDALIRGSFDKVPSLFHRKSMFKWWSLGEFALDAKTEHISYKGKPLDGVMNTRAFAMLKEGQDARPLLRFYQRLSKNPSHRSVSGLFKFLEHADIPLAEDGCILAYKSVRRDYKDHHSGTFINRPGSVHEMPRNEISDDPRVACHVGFHVGNRRYTSSFGGDRRIVVCKVDPENVVCVPYDHGEGKMRVCHYEVIGNYGDTFDQAVWDEDILIYTDDEHLPELTDDDIVQLEDEVTQAELLPQPMVEELEEVLDQTDADPPPPLGLEVSRREELEALRFDALRGLATAEPLLIKGAGRLKGGKGVLISVILDREEELRLIAEAAKERLRLIAEAAKPKPAVKAPKVVEDVKLTYERIHKMTDEDLADVNIGHLRKYATHRLNIIGASKILGGKPKLIERILEVRKGLDTPG